jgi:peptidoglycan/xylan/chitin deacetylase (PgdA/CDA1 family)
MRSPVRAAALEAETMGLPDDYTRYPRRGPGMDHDRYDWSMLPERPKIAWPGGARVALWLVPVLEWFPMDMPAKPFLAPGGLARPYPDYWNFSHREYGNRVGVWRLFKVLDGLGLKASVAINSALAERYPVLLDETTRRGWEVIAGGVHMGKLHYGGLDREEEAAQVRECVSTLRRLSGQPVTGWLSPAKSESHATPDLVAAEGIEYLCDWINDDLPFPFKTEAGTLHSMPHSHELSDRLILQQNRHTSEEFAQQIRDQFDWLYAEAETGGGRIMAVTLHPWLSGQAHRVKPLRAALAHITAHDGVWSATGAEILEAFKGQG